MKRRILKTIVAMFIMTAITVTPQLSYNVKGEELHETKSISNIDLKDLKIEKELDFGDAGTDHKERQTRSGDLVAGTVSDYLGATDAYIIYPVSLNSGQYFQAQLAVPNDSNIDYDFYLLDANGSILASGDSETYINGIYGTLPEALGYIASTTATYYIYVISALGGSSTVPFTLDYSICTSYDTLESDESYHEMVIAGSIGNNGYTTSSRNLNSPVDNDWYDFIVPANAGYDQLIIEANTSSANTCKVELYQNVSSNNWYQMRLISNGIPYTLSAGEYYLRISNQLSMEDFDDNDIQNYTLSIRPVQTANSVTIDSMSGTEGIKYVTYTGYGNKFRTAAGTVTVSGTAYDSNHNPRADVPVRVKYHNQYWANAGVPDWANVEQTGYTDGNGNYSIRISIPQAYGALSAHVTVSTHYFDICDMSVEVDNNSYAITDTESFFLFSHLIMD